MARSIAKARVITPWTASYDPALAVHPGEAVTLGKTDPDHPGWQWVENAQGLGGWVPSGIVTDGRTTEAFDTQELTVQVGEQVVLLETRLGWTRAHRQDDAEGWVPSDHLAPQFPDL